MKHSSQAVTEAALSLLGSPGDRADHTLLNVSHDTTRELYSEYNELFVAHWREQTGDKVIIQQSHGASGSQTKGVIKGLRADVVTLAQACDVDAIAFETGILPKDWQTRLPNKSVPYTSTVVFVVRKGNPKCIRDWEDLTRRGVSIVTPNPRTSGGARWCYLAAWAFARRKYGSEYTAREFVSRLYGNVAVLDVSSVGSMFTFDRRATGDVLLSWESDALRLLDERPGKNYEIVTPSLSILAELPVCLVKKHAREKGVFKIANAYLEHLYSPEAQRIIASHHFRPLVPGHAAVEDLTRLSSVELVSVDEGFGGWRKVKQTHFSQGGIVDQLSVLRLLMKAFDQQPQSLGIPSGRSIVPVMRKAYFD